jgi:xanthine dehydrogenase YagR molybdenum-binding subunit
MIIMAESIGQPLDRVDGRLKVTGMATYSAEHRVGNLVYAVLVTSTIAKGRIASIDTGAAKKVPSVLAVLTHQDRLKLAMNPMVVHAGSPADRALQLLQDDRIYYSNQPIAMAVAETLEAAQEAAGLVEVRYSADKPSVTLNRNLSDFYTPKKIGGAGDPAGSSRGDVQAGLAAADARIAHPYSTPFQHHNPMEPHATIAVWDGSDKLTLYDASQGIFGDRKRVADLLGLQPDNVRVVALYLGGGFGSKGPTWSHVLLCAMAARHVHRPVKLVLARPQMFGPVGCRTETRQTIAAGAKRNGTLTALRNETLSHTSTMDEFTESASVPTRMLYSVPNNSTQQRLIRSDIGTPSYTRAPGEAPGTYALEAAMDELAYALKMDPLELRRKNYADHDPDKNRPWSGKALDKCYDIGAQNFGWSRRPPEPRSMRDGNVLIGWGMATSVYPARRSEASAVARLYSDGTIHVDAGSQELGGGTYTIMTQLAADGVGVSPERIKFRLGDTRYPETPVSGGSQTAASAGSAVYLAARALREKLIQTAISDAHSPVHGANTSDITIKDGRIGLSQPSGKWEALETLVARSGQPYIEGFADTKAGDEAKQYSGYSFGAQFAEVRIDADLGQMRVSRMLGAFGAGRILNAKTARSQFLGGMVWGIGFALYEHSVYDERLGRIVNNNLAEYHVPTNADVGSIEAFWVDDPDDHVSPIGAKGIGEIGITGAAAAIANAVFHATGKRVRDLPITLDKLI